MQAGLRRAPPESREALAGRARLHDGICREAGPAERGEEAGAESWLGAEEQLVAFQDVPPHLHTEGKRYGAHTHYWE